MGLEFIEKAGSSFHKGLDRKRAQLATPTLFTQQPRSKPRVYAANLHPGSKTHDGEQLGVRQHCGKVLVMRGIDPIATIENPPPELLEALIESYDEACGVVQHVYEMAGVAEISLC